MEMLTKQLAFKAESISDLGVVSGVLNAFGNKDYANDITVKGAFSKSLVQLKSDGRELVMLWQHDHSVPIGIWKNLKETSRGLEGDGHINLDVQQGREAYSLAKQGALSGISIGYHVIDEEYDYKSTTNYLKEVSLIETSLVTFPANDLSRVEEVKLNLKNKGFLHDFT